MRSIAILGSTGSIGTQALDVALRHHDAFSVAALVAHANAPLLFEQVRAFRPRMAGLSGVAADAIDIPADLRFCDWFFGEEALRVAAAQAEADAVLVSVVGFAGLNGVMAALEAGAADVQVLEDCYEVVTEVTDFSTVREALEQQGFSFLSAELSMIPQTTNDVTDPEVLQKIEKMLDMLDDMDDVQNVYHNGNLPEDDEEE